MVGRRPQRRPRQQPGGGREQGKKQRKATRSTSSGAGCCKCEMECFDCVQCGEKISGRLWGCHHWTEPCERHSLSSRSSRPTLGKCGSTRWTRTNSRTLQMQEMKTLEIFFQTAGQIPHFARHIAMVTGHRFRLLSDHQHLLEFLRSARFVVCILSEGPTQRAAGSAVASALNCLPTKLQH